LNFKIPSPQQRFGHPFSSSKAFPRYILIASGIPIPALLIEVLIRESAATLKQNGNYNRIF